MDNSSFDYSALASEILGFKILGRKYLSSRWWQIIAAALMMGLVSPYQYVWSSIEGPMASSLGVPLNVLGVVFTLFVIFQAGSQFPVGWWRDRYGPQKLTLLSGILAGGGYIGISQATEVWQIYILYSIGAIGVGIIYTIAVNTALKWFPDRRGLTTGIGTMAFAGGSAFFIPYVRINATAAGYPDVLQNMGLLILIGVTVGALVLRDPPENWLQIKTNTKLISEEKVNSTPPSSLDFTSGQMIKTWQFWLMYLMFIAVSGAGLTLTAKVVALGDSLALTATAVTAAATVLPIAGGTGRLVVGYISDDKIPGIRLGFNRERAMALSFSLCGLGLVGTLYFGNLGNSIGFIASVFVATFFWSPQYTLFPSVVADYYGSKNSSANYALLYSGKVWGGIFGGAVAGWLVVSSGWTVTFLIGSGLALCAGGFALLLRPPTTISPN
tara:strand:+ start:746 stop:2068 length:1323 start_codon:yes stop_codon:yes gene_type:complete